MRIMASDRFTTLGEIAESVFSGKAVSRLKPGKDRICVVNIRDIDVQIAPVANLEVQTDVDGKNVAHLRLRDGDVVLTARGIVRAAVAGPEHADAIPGANIVVVRLPRTVPPKVIAAYLRHPQITAVLMQEFVGSTTAGFSVEGLKRLSLSLAEPASLERLSLMVDATDRYYAAMVEAAAARRELALELVMLNLNPAIKDAP